MEAHFDVVIGNPPFIRYQNFPRRTSLEFNRGWVREWTSRQAYFIIWVPRFGYFSKQVEPFWKVGNG